MSAAEFITKAEAARRLSVPIGAVDRMIRTGRLAVRTLPVKAVVLASSVDGIVAELAARMPEGRVGTSVAAAAEQLAAVG